MRRDVPNEFAVRATVWSKHEYARAVLAKTLDACGRAGIAVLPVKGIVTAGLLYHDVSLRPIQDVDLRVRPADLPAVLHVGKRAGWPIVARSRAYDHLTFRIDGWLVEFEGHVGPRGVCSLSVGDLLARARVQKAPLGFEHLQAELHDHVLLMMLNAFKDKMFDAPPAALCDLELFAALPHFEVRKLVERARAGGVTGLAWLTAQWMAEVRGAAVWRPVACALEPLLRNRRHLDTMRDRLRAPERRAGTLLRMLTRAAADAPTGRIAGLGWMACYALEKATGRVSRPLQLRRS